MIVVPCRYEDIARSLSRYQIGMHTHITGCNLAHLLRVWSGFRVCAF